MTKQDEAPDAEMKSSELHDQFLDGLADMLHAQRQMVKALPKMAKAAKSQELAAAFESLLAETKDQIIRLEQIFASVDTAVKSRGSKAMKGLLKEGEYIREAPPV